MFFFDNTKSVRDNAKYTSVYTPGGSEAYEYEVGQVVQATVLSVYRQGVTFVITSRYMENGYAYYVADNGSVHRIKDIEPFPY